MALYFGPGRLKRMPVKAVYVGVNLRARPVKAIYLGVNGRRTPVWTPPQNNEGGGNV